MRLDFKHVGSSYYMFKNQCNQVRIDVIQCNSGPTVAFLKWKHGIALSQLVHGMQ